MEIDSEKLRMARLAVPLTQRELAAKAGVTATTIVRLEAGHPARISTVRKLAKALKTPASAILRSGKEEQ